MESCKTNFGYFLGVLVFTPFEDWRFAHLRHHVTYANLDARGFGDIWTMTLTEYENVSKKKRFCSTGFTVSEKVRYHVRQLRLRILNSGYFTDF
jgi:fatty acid desaturase